MASVTVRPIANAGSGGTITASSGSSNYYQMVYEASQDGDSTYVSLGSAGANLLVLCDNTLDTTKVQTINSVTMYIVLKDLSSTESITYGFNSPMASYTSASGISSGYTTLAYTLSVSKTPANFNLGSLILYISMDTLNTAKNSIWITQMYAVVNYTEKKPLVAKVGNAWHDTSLVKVKIGGAWRTGTIYKKVGGTWRGS